MNNFTKILKEDSFGALSERFTVIIPTRGLNGKYLKLVIESYNKFLDPLSIYEIIIITPDDNVKEYVKKYNNFKFKVLKDEEVVPIIPLVAQGDGWIIQQYIKLMIAANIETDYYMIFDDDLFLVKPLKYEDLFHNVSGDLRLRYSSEPLKTLSTPTFSSKTWWEGSAKLLHVRFPQDKSISDYLDSIFHSEQRKRDDDDKLMSVTPQVFVTEYVLKLLLELPIDWMTKFKEYGASEYSLYWLFLRNSRSEPEGRLSDVSRNSGLHEKYTDECTHWWYTDSNTSLLNPTDNVDELTRIIYNGIHNNKGYFMVIQSWIGIDEGLIKMILDKVQL